MTTYGNLVASCGEPCPRYFLTDAESGTTTHVRPPAGYSFQAGYAGAFSPDGPRLAVAVVANHGQDRRDYPRYLGRRDYPRWSMALVNIASGTARVIKASTVDPVYQAMAWSASGRRVFFNAGRGRIMAYQRGSARATGFAHLRSEAAKRIIQMAAP